MQTIQICVLCYRIGTFKSLTVYGTSCSHIPRPSQHKSSGSLIYTSILILTSCDLNYFSYVHRWLSWFPFPIPLLTWEWDKMSIIHTLQPLTHMEEPSMSTEGSVKRKDTSSTKVVGSVLYFLVITITLQVWSIVFVCFRKIICTWITRQFPPMIQKWDRGYTSSPSLCVTLAQWVLPCEW